MELVHVCLTATMHYPASTKPVVPDVIVFPNSLGRACDLAGIDVVTAQSQNRTRAIAHRRFHVMFLLRSWGKSTPQIGKMLNRDHSTICHGLRRWRELHEGGVI